MSEGFIPLAAFLRPVPPQVPDFAGVPQDDIPQGDLVLEWSDVFSALRRFRAGVADALDAAVQRLLMHVAEDVLSRELRVAPAEIAAIVAKARDRVAPERVIAVRVHPAQRHAVAMLQVETHVDDSLDQGDVVVELRSGTIDLRLRTRLAMALAACGP